MSCMKASREREGRHYENGCTISLAWAACVSRVRQGNAAREMTMREACRGQGHGGGECVFGRQGRRGRKRGRKGSEGVQQGGGIAGWPRLACHGATVCLALPPGVDALPVPAAATILASDPYLPYGSGFVHGGRRRQ